MPRQTSSPLLWEKQTTLRQLLQSFPRLAIAYSGGVDSTYLLAEATALLGSNAQGVIADSPSLPRKALAKAIQVAENFGAQVRVIRTAELERPEYVANPLNRCYFCKHELFTRMEQMAKKEGFAALAYGENADDALENRPGSRAAHEFRVVAPLREARLTKSEIRQSSRELDLPTADEPAQPCLSSRIPHGMPVTRFALKMIEEGEEALRGKGFKVLRIRYVAGEKGSVLANIQVASSELNRLYLLAAPVKDELIRIGFSSVSIDPLGYRAPALSSVSRNESST
jgi:pyridinium-3,5-biscarboxylic acid mononucleotide sulfurtransferase